MVDKEAMCNIHMPLKCVAYSCAAESQVSVCTLKPKPAFSLECLQL